MVIAPPIFCSGMPRKSRSMTVMERSVRLDDGTCIVARVANSSSLLKLNLCIVGRCAKLERVRGLSDGLNLRKQEARDHRAGVSVLLELARHRYRLDHDMIGKHGFARREEQHEGDGKHMTVLIPARISKVQGIRDEIWPSTSSIGMTPPSSAEVLMDAA